MIYEFRNPIPVKTDIGYGYLMYVRDGGTYCNDMRTDQFAVLRNPTFDIENEDK